MRTSSKLLLAILLATSVIVAACSNDDGDVSNVSALGDESAINPDSQDGMEGTDADERPLQGEVERPVEDPQLEDNQEMATGEEGRAQNEVLTYEEPATLEPTLAPVDGSNQSSSLTVELVVNPREGSACINYDISSAPQITRFEVLRGTQEQGGMLSADFEVSATTGTESCEALDLDLLNDLATDHEGFYITAIDGSTSDVVFQSSGLGS